MCFQRGGGGGGGRISVTATSSYTYLGDYQTYGGRSQSEVGGSGTTFLSTPAKNFTSQETSLILNNYNKGPLEVSINNINNDSGRTYILVTENESFDSVVIRGYAHLAFRKRTDVTHSVSIAIGTLQGDNTGMVHSSQELHVGIAECDDPFPTSLRVYDNSQMGLPRSELSSFFS